MEDIINKTISVFAKKINGIDYENKITVFEQIKKIDTNCYNQLKNLKSNLESYKFVKTDKELRIKAPDIWKFQKSVFTENIKSSVNALLEISKQYNID